MTLNDASYYKDEFPSLYQKWITTMQAAFIMGGQVAAQLADGDGTPLSVDPLGALVGIAYPHHEVHEGSTFNSSLFVLALADDASIDFLVRVPVGTEGHISVGLSCGGDAEWQLHDGSAWTDAGTDMLASNMKRNSPKVATVTVTHTPTFGALGDLIQNLALGGGTGGNAGGGSQVAVRGNTEWILAPGVHYGLRLFNRSGSAKIASMDLQWYEETPM